MLAVIHHAAVHTGTNPFWHVTLGGLAALLAAMFGAYGSVRAHQIKILVNGQFSERVQELKSLTRQLAEVTSQRDAIDERKVKREENDTK